MSPVAFLVPAAIHDGRYPSGGNRYDVELVAALRLVGWRALFFWCGLLGVGVALLLVIYVVRRRRL